MDQVMLPFNFNNEEILTFFAVLVRYSVLVAVLPFVGDRFVSVPIKILLALGVTLCLFPMLVATGQVRPDEAAVWGNTTGGIVSVITLEAMTGVVLGFTAKLVFDAIQFGTNLTGNFMGFSMASTYDPHQESQSQVIAEFYMALVMLLFLSLDGHHLMLRAALDSYRVVGLGRMNLGTAFSEKLLDLSGQVIRFGIQLSAPIAITIFAVNVIFGILSKAMPQLNVLVLSFAVTSLLGLAVMFIGLPEFQGASASILERIGDWIDSMKVALSKA